VPRPPQDSYHELVHSWLRPSGSTLARVLRQEPSGIYQLDAPTGKRTAQVSRAGSGFKDDDRDPYEKWSQALASAADLVRDAGAVASDGQQALSLILPMLVVADGTLWVADYCENGERISAAQASDSVELFVDREYVWEVPAMPASQIYRICHLHIYTRTGFSAFTQQLSRGDRLRHLIFEFGLQQVLR
jgi:hypothetical protein